MFNPCPCTSRQTGAHIIAAIDMLISLFFLIVFNITITQSQEEFADDEHLVESYTIVRILFSIFFLTKLILGVCLYFGASDKNFQLCLGWLFFEPIYFLFIFWGTVHKGINENSVVGGVFMLFSIYAMLTAYALIDELRTGNVIRVQPGAGLTVAVNGNSVDPAPYSYPSPYPYPYQMTGMRVLAGYYPQTGSAEQGQAAGQQQQYPPANYNYSQNTYVATNPMDPT